MVSGVKRLETNESEARATMSMIREVGKMKKHGGTLMTTATWLTGTPPKLAKRSWMTVALLGLLTGCGSQIDPGTDGSTHWLSCNTDAQCGELRCVDHRCKPAAEPTPEPTPEPDSAAPTPVPPSSEGDGRRALGETCLPAEEYLPEFSSFGQGDVIVEQSSQCSTGTCLVNHFMGRVTCLYGGEPSDAGFHDCETPDGQPVTVAVPPQRQDRSPENAVYCSCRCDGPDPSADYCECGAGFECVPLAPVEVPGAEAVVGSYCVKQGTTYDRNGLHRPCDAETASCGEASRYDAQTLGIELTEEQLGAAQSFEYFADLGGDFADQTACLPRTLPVAESDEGTGAACRIFELIPGGDGCSGPGRLPVDEATVELARLQLMSVDVCSTEAECGEYTVCEVPQIVDAESTCRTQEAITEDGWCYLSELHALGNPELLDACPDGPSRGKLRFGGAGVLTPGAFSYVACSGQR